MYYIITQNYYDQYEDILSAAGYQVGDFVYIDDETGKLKKVEGIFFKPPPTDPPPANPPDPDGGP